MKWLAAFVLPIVALYGSLQAALVIIRAFS
jgi:hypothetical protein